jgi:hypothetical protein
MTPQAFNGNSRLRASDADRDTAASVINNAMAEGRLTAEEHSERRDAIYSARTHAELAPLLDDLPATGTAAAPVPAAGPAAPVRRGGRMIAILGGSVRKGVWHPDPAIQIVTVLGGAELDFREAVLPPGNEVVIHATNVLGGMEIVVPPEMRVIDNGIAILGGREVAGETPESMAEGAPVLRIEGACVLGGIEVKRKARRGPKGERRREILDRIRADRHEIHAQMREQRHEIHDQMREQRRAARRNWTGESGD